LRNIRKAAKGKRKEWMLFHDGLLELHAFDQLTALTSSGVGGGSHIYTSILEKPSPDFYDFYPSEISADEMDPYFEKVRNMMRPSPIPDKPEKNRVFESAVREAGLPPPEYPDLAVAWGEDPEKPERIINAAGVSQFSSTYRSDVFVGCEDGSKTTLDLTYIPTAEQHGAEVLPLCEVYALDKTENGYQVNYFDYRIKKPTTVVAPRLILAAGCLNTLRLLFAARDKNHALPNISARLGQGFSPNGDLSAFLWRSKVLQDSSFGTPFNAYTRKVENGAYRFLVGEVGLPVQDLPVIWPLSRWLRRSTYLFAMGRDASNGVVGFDGKGLVTDIGRSMDADYFRKAKDAIATIAHAYHPKKIVNDSGIFTVHPMGGCGIGNNARDGVTDHKGQVFGYKDLYVADGSLYPRSPGIAPSMTIAAFAERQAALID
jgi:cholesterol oxidase